MVTPIKIGNGFFIFSWAITSGTAGLFYFLAASCVLRRTFFSSLVFLRCSSTRLVIISLYTLASAFDFSTRARTVDFHWRLR